MSTREDLIAFYRGCERGEPPDTPLAKAYLAYNAFDLPAAENHLAVARETIEDGAFAHVADLLEIAVAIRRAKDVPGALERMQKFLENVGPEEAPIRARAVHIRAVAEIRLGHLEAAEADLATARRSDSAISRRRRRTSRRRSS